MLAKWTLVSLSPPLLYSVFSFVIGPFSQIHFPISYKRTMLQKYHPHNRHSYMMVQKQSWLLMDDDDLSDEFDVYNNSSAVSKSSPYASGYFNSSTPSFGQDQIFRRDTASPSLFARKPKPTSLYKRLSIRIKSTLHQNEYNDNSRKKKKKEKQSQDGKTNPME